MTTAKVNLGGWQISNPDERGELHVVPLNDLKVHMDEDCECKPKRDTECLNLWIHNSFDKREEFENGIRKTN